MVDVDVRVLSHFKKELALTTDKWLQVISTIMLFYTVVWEKFTVRYFHMKFVRVKIFSSSRVADKNFYQ